MRIVLLSLLATACYTSVPPTKTVANQPPPVAALVPAKLYAGLFVRGAHFTYKVETESSHWDDQDPDADQNGNVTQKSSGTMTCTVTEVTKLRDAIASDVSCDESLGVPVGGASPQGTYVATAAGLWRTDGIPSAAPTDAKTMLLAAIPAETKVVDGDPENEGFSSQTSVSRNGAGEWCWEESSVGGDEGGSTICFANGVISGGSAFFAGGSSHDATYTLTSR